MVSVVLHEKNAKSWTYNIVYLYNYTVNILCIKTGDGYDFHCMLKQAEIDVQSTSNRKLPNFYWKVTEFLNDDKIMRLQKPAAFAIYGVC